MSNDIDRILYDENNKRIAADVDSHMKDWRDSN